MSISTIEKELARKRFEDMLNSTIHDVNLFELAEQGDLKYLREITTILKRNHDKLSIKSWLNGKNSKGQTPLIIAILNNNLNFAEFLLDQGASIDEQDATGHTALMASAFKGNIKALSLLINKGAQINTVNHSNISALDYAKLFGKDEAVEFLEKHLPLENSINNNRMAIGLKFFKSIFLFRP